ncbi:terminase large subunit [Staphylococcus simulans]|uniref:terminase large subunit n=1 Tax=Staphylococcus simulans TaxID=1286 RepID=UPI001E62BF32|nr:terminase TerL endonuclease subunit [Staphylococcus simulans]MCD8914260.1 terminase large subunit [Staphylococcus simulans]MDN6205982.1 terminase large subunit [Staphylococcus simulans]
MPSQNDYVTQYAQAVVKGDILASRKNIQACERHLRDLNNKDFKYHFDVEEANKIIRFLEMLPDPKTGKAMQLASFQKFIAGSLMGWKTELGNRRFTKGYLSMARKNGKTLLISGLSLYEMLLGDEPVNERLVGLSANSREQAGIAYDMTKAQMETIRMQSARMKEVTKITDSKKEIINLKDRSKIKAVSNEASNLEGYQFSYAIIDEFHEAKDRRMYETLRRGQVLLNNPSLIIISTAGENLNGPMFEEYEYVTKILSREVNNENYFAFVAEQDDEKEAHDSSTWIKSNPLLELDQLRYVLTRNIEAEVQEGIDNHGLNGILVKNFNMWRQASKDTYIPYHDWAKGYTEDELDIKGRDVYVGIDLSRSEDLTAVSFIYPLKNKNFYVDAHVFVGTKQPIQEKSKKDKIDYLRLVQTDMATLTKAESGIIDYEQVFWWLDDFIKRNNLNVKAIAYDSWSASSFVTKAEHETDYMLVEVPQNYKHMSPALKQFRLDVFENKIKHSNNPNLNLAINNAITKTDNNNNILLDKQMNRNKIDALVALVTAYTLAMNYEFDSSMQDYIMSDDFGF